MYAVIESGGRQYKVQVGQAIEVDRLAAADGETVELGRVLMVSDGDQMTVGQPTVPGARVLAEVIEETRGPKIIVFRYKPKVRYRRKLGHRQLHTRVRISGIETGATLAEVAGEAEA